MYSIVMATILTAGGGATGFGHPCHGGYRYVYTCQGCYGGYASQWQGCSGWHGWKGVADSSSPCCGIPKTADHQTSAAQSPSSTAMPTSSEIRALTEAINGLRKELAAKKSEGPLPKQPPATNPPAPKTPGQGNASSRVATITVTLPSAARLWVDDQVCPLTSAERSFNTAPLEPGEYFFILSMEIEQDGQIVHKKCQVDFTPGQHMSVDFNSNVPQIARR